MYGSSVHASVPETSRSCSSRVWNADVDGPVSGYYPTTYTLPCAAATAASPTAQALSTG